MVFGSARTGDVQVSVAGVGFCGVFRVPGRPPGGFLLRCQSNNDRIGTDDVGLSVIQRLLKGEVQCGLRYRLTQVAPRPSKQGGLVGGTSLSHDWAIVGSPLAGPKPAPAEACSHRHDAEKRNPGYTRTEATHTLRPLHWTASAHEVTRVQRRSWDTGTRKPTTSRKAVTPPTGPTALGRLTYCGRHARPTAASLAGSTCVDERQRGSQPGTGTDRQQTQRGLSL
jgi:hypothetical protein